MNKLLYLILPLLLCCCSKKSEWVDYAELVRNNDYERAHAQLDIEAEKVVRERLNKATLAEKYVNNYYFVLKAEADFLLDKDDPEFERLFLERLSDFNPEEYVASSYAKQVGEFNTTKYNYGNEQYQKAIARYNEYCLTVIRKAMIRHRVDLARKIIMLIRDDLVYEPRQTSNGTITVWRNAGDSRAQAEKYLAGATD